MLDRRELICGCISAALLGSATANSARSASGVDYPCGIVGNNLKLLENTGQLHAVGDIGSATSLEQRYNLNLVESSQNAAFESALGQMLVYLANEFGVYPAFRYYEDFGEPNAMAASDKLQQYASNSDGTVLLGIEFFLNAIKIKNGDAGILAVCAHEFAHIAAFKRQLRAEIYSLQLREFAFELHADFLAGVFLRKQEQLFPDLDVTGVIPLWKKFGSPRFTNPGTHGTTEMRRNAINTGYFTVADNPTISFDDAYGAASRHISQYTK